MEKGHFDEDFVKNTRKRGPAGKLLKFFLPDAPKATFWIENLTKDQRKSGPFFQKSGHPLSPSCAPVSVNEYVSISQNIP